MISAVYTGSNGVTKIIISAKNEVQTEKPKIIIIGFHCTVTIWKYNRCFDNSYL